MIFRGDHWTLGPRLLAIAGICWIAAFSAAATAAANTVSYECETLIVCTTVGGCQPGGAASLVRIDPETLSLSVTSTGGSFANTELLYGLAPPTNKVAASGSLDPRGRIGASSFVIFNNLQFVQSFALLVDGNDFDHAFGSTIFGSCVEEGA